MGKGNFTYDSFKAAYDSDPRLQALVTNFDQNSIELKSSETDDLANPSKSGNANTVNQMAKNAVDLKGL